VEAHCVKLRNEHIRSYIDDIEKIGLLEMLTWKGSDVAPTWIGAFQPATRSNDSRLHDLAKFSRDHYLFYRALVEQYVEKEGNVLDVGCGTGARTAMLARYSTSVLGIDSDMMKISAAASLNGVESIKWLFAEFLEWANDPNAYGQFGKADYVFAVEVIEHLPVTLHSAFIRLMLSRLQPDGCAMLTTPRDKEPDRKEPHIGLWDDPTAEKALEGINREIRYFNVNQLHTGGEDPWSHKKDSTHYVVIIRP